MRLKEAEKILKYKDLTIEIQRMWNVKARVIPVIIGATGTISKIIQKIREQHTTRP
jgi:RNase P/RNase MRP subunit POP5